ncbi:MAG: DEAD/DEAH box helicase family protein [Syntrophaceticus schinkii]|nr:DEAD/DEAH box helicase family protein [Syntrophaceticus schinkii]
MNKKNMTEADIRTKYITPAIESAGWDKMTQLREEYTFTAGRIIVRGKLMARGKKKRVDYLLLLKPNIPLAIIEAKDNHHSVGDGMQQALAYADSLDVPFAFSSNGDAFLFHNRITGIETELSLNKFPSPVKLWDYYKQGKDISDQEENIIIEDYFFDPNSPKTPRYYQMVAINRIIEAIAKGQDKILCVCATGTGKTYIAFQVIYRLWKSKTKKRILYLADRNILIDQTMINDFKHFGSIMTKVKHRQVDKSYEIYMALYQGLTGSEEWQNIYKQFSPDFFDLVIVDECHRGSAKEDSAWREVLEYFSSATQIGLTATPKETKDVSNIEYFGEPIYTYSLRQGIADGFLAPYKVIRVSIDKDVEGWRPTKGQIDQYGFEIEDKEYNLSDFDRNLVLQKRTQLVAEKVTEYLQKTNRFQKAIVFCIDIEHAERMRQALNNLNADLVKENHKYIMRITGDNEEGKAELDNFIDPYSKYPVIATTSKLLTTGVDAQTTKLIVLDTVINSMTEFKQIIGRGTRIREDCDKFYFTIIDFRNATRLFADPSFDGEPVQVYEPKEDEDIVPPEIDYTDIDDHGDYETSSTDEDLPVGREKLGDQKPAKYYVNNVEVKVLNQRVQYLDRDGKLITESLKDYTRKNIKEEFASIDDFIKKWNSAEKKQVIIDELRENGVFFEELQEEVGKDFDAFDLICHVAFDMPPLTRRDRANNVKKKNYFGQYSETARKVIDALLDKYADEGLEDIETASVLTLEPFIKYGSPAKIIKEFGGKKKFNKFIKELGYRLYA